VRNAIHITLRLRYRNRSGGFSLGHDIIPGRQ
jgi:hypothetical protein